jgi:kojibiose phosphorylase
MAEIRVKDFFLGLCSSEDWLIIERGWKPQLQGVRESLFALGNGFLGSRGFLEEIPDGAYPGTYIAGIYDKSEALVEELVNMPNPVDFRISIEGEKLDISRMPILSHSQALDMKNGFLKRRTVFIDSKKRRFDYQSLRFFSSANPHIGGLRIYLTALDMPAHLTAQDLLNEWVTNQGGLMEGAKRHFSLQRAFSDGRSHYICVKTHDHDFFVAYATHISVDRGGQELDIKERTFGLKLPVGQTVCFTKLFSILSRKDAHPIKVLKNASILLEKAKAAGFDTLLKKHIEVFNRLWRSSDVKISGDPQAQKALRFNIYHLLISASPKRDGVSIGAKTLTGEGYRGHIFWDTELYILPFFIYTDPRIARKLLLYRYKRLDAARLIARQRGFRGALFPWESAHTGEDATPPYSRDLDGSIMKIVTMEKEQHISSDVAFGVYHYYLVTEDSDFMLHAGLEIIFETARFWASRVKFERRLGKFVINDVMGPDEFHESVNNNAYTNLMAIWNLNCAASLFNEFSAKVPRRLKRLADKIGLKAKEVKRWRGLAGKISIPVHKDRDVIEAFDGYFKKKHIWISGWDENLMPVFLRRITTAEASLTQIVKQADVLMAIYLLSDKFSEEDKRRNFNFYFKRTAHKSSLSTSVHSILAARLGYRALAYILFLNSLYTDLRNLHGNTHDGIHAACLGGNWQTVIFGFAGLNMNEGRLSFCPRLPGHWESVSFKLRWRQRELSLRITRDNLEIYFPSPKKKDTLTIWVNGGMNELTANIANRIRIPQKEAVMVKVKDVMTKRVISVKETATIREVSDVMSRWNLTGLPVTDNKMSLLGFISEKDIIKSMRKPGLMKKKVKDIMVKKVVTIQEGASIELAVKLFIERPYRRLPVVRDRKVVGVISRKDIVEKLAHCYY